MLTRDENDIFYLSNKIKQIYLVGYVNNSVFLCYQFLALI